MATKIKGLQQWCKRMTDGYRDVNVIDFTKSWRDGLAFCAMIHRFRPDLIDFDSLSKENVYENNHLAFTVAEQELDIPAFLEAADMVALKTPDKLSVITYVSQYYNKLGSLPQLGGPGVREKTAPAASAGTKRHQKAEPLSEPEPKKQPPARNVGGDSKAKGKSLGDKCGICNNKVYLLERHIEDGKLFHRSCYRHSDLSPTNKVYTRSPFMSPSLHGKDGGSTPTSKSPQTFFPSDKGAGVGKTSAVEEKHGVKRPSDDAKSDEKSKKSGIQKLLFSDKSKDTGSDVSKDRPGLSNLKIPAKSETSNTAQADKILSPTPKFDARSLEKHSLDFLSTEKDIKDVKSPKRQLPLIFQAAEKDDTSGAKDTTKNGPDMKTSLFSKDKAGSSQSSVLSGNKGESDSKSFLSGIKGGGDSKSSVLPRSRLDIAKSVSNTKESEKSSGPVAKPRQIGKKVVEEKMDTSEPVQIRSKSPFPKAAPRSSLAQAEPSQKPTSSLPRSPPALRKARTKSPARDLSPEHSAPPPLPSSAPPPLPLSVPPSASPHPSPRHLPSATSHSKETTKPSEALLPKKSDESSSKTPRQKSVSASVASMVLSSASNKASASGGKDSAPHLPSRPPPKLSVVSSEASSSNSSAGSPRPPAPASVSISSKTTSSSATSVPSALTSKSTSSSSKDTSTTFTSKSTISIPSNKVREEPMDVDIAFNKARSQYGEEPVAVMVVPVDKDKKKTALSGLLSSLAKVRSAPSSSTTTSTTTTSSSSALSADKTHSKSSALSSDSKSASNTTEKIQNRFSVPSSSSDFKSASSNADKSQSRFSVPTSESKSTSSSGFVSSKVGRLETKDSDHKSSLEFALSGKDKSDRVSPRDIQISNSQGKSSLARGTQKHGDVLISKNKDSQSKVSPRFQDISADTKLPDRKLSEPVTVTLNIGNKGKEEPSKPKSSIFSNLKLNGKHAEQNGKAVDDTPQWKKNLADSRVNSANKSQAEPMDMTSSLSVDFPGRRDRAKSAADVLATKTLSSSKQSAATADSLQPPPFMQVKLRDSGNSTVDRKERSKSAGNVFENSVSGESKPAWQLEAERRMAALRDTGFVDPEFKKSTSGSESPEEEEDNTVMRKDKKEEPVALVVPQRHIAGFSPRGEENLQARMKEEAKKSDGKLEKAGKESKPEVKASVSKQPTAAEKDKSAADKDSSKPAKKGLNLNLRGILKSEEKNRPAPTKPERHIPPASKQQEPEIKVSPATPRAPDKPSDPSLRASPKESEDTAAKKKIAVGKDTHTTSPPPRPSTPPRKKVSVDINFDFNASNSLEVSEQPKERPPPPKLTPPARPPPPRTSMSPGRISAIELQHQLLDIDSKLSELELRGRHLEDSIRSAVVEEEDDLMVEWFQLVTDKNDLVRKETDLVYMSREQELEDEQSQIESQLRYLLTLEDNDKSFEEKQEEDYLIERKLDIVNQRNSIVDSMDEDRLRYEEEDRDIAQVLQEKGYRRDSTSSSPVKSPEKGGKKKDKKGKVKSSKFYA